uniref:Transposase n=1 Tax=Nicotiana tabacum TaxID=4097 RepID=A0A1S3YNX5_TOBAC|nr:PREDICTED: uncharacterized protein LOC107778035 [Nicotiana tabacum]
MELAHRRWMCNRTYPNRSGLREEFIEGVAEFMAKTKTLHEFLSEGVISEGSPSAENNAENSRFSEMVRDAFVMHPGAQSEPNDDARRFYEQLEEASRPLYKGSMHSKLSVAVRLLSIKSDSSISQAGMDSIISLMNELNPNKIDLPKDFYTTKKLVSKLGLSSERIDCCEKGCMLFYKDDAALENCKFCNQPRYKKAINSKKKKVPVKAMHYLPLIPRLKRPPGILCHPSDGEAWKHFDRLFPNSASEPRNIRLGLCADGFTPFSVSATPYSCWPMFVTPYNLPPELCMTSPYLFLTCIVPGPRNPKSLIDVYMQPLIDELKLLWHEGVETYDISTKQNFRLHAALIWTINDFPAYGMLSGWSIAGKLACPTCMEETKAFTLKHGGKNTWFDCHRRFLPMDHQFRRNTSASMKNQTDFEEPPSPLSPEEIWNRVRFLPKVTESLMSNKIPGYGVTHNWTKQSIFWELSYWRHNLLRHNLDVMHIEKNFFDNLFNTIMDVNNKTKDNLKARMDLKEYCRRSELYLTYLNNKIQKPKASYTFTLDERREICDWVKNLRMPDGYASNLSRPNRHDDGGVSDPLAPPFSIFNQPGRGPKTSKTRNLTEMEKKSATTHVLLNCPEAQPYYNYFIGVNGHDAIYPRFSEWFREFVHNPVNGINDPFLRDITWGPDHKVKIMSKYFVNGYKFHTKEWSKNKKTNNSGVWVKSDGDVDYYGVLQEILELEYFGWPRKKLVLFRCK